VKPIDRRKANRPVYAPEAHGTPLPVVLRAATLDDVPGIAEVDDARGMRTTERVAPRIRRSLARQLAEQPPAAYTCVGLLDGRIVGYARCALKTWPGGAAEAGIPDGWYLTGVEVLAAFRRGGIGRGMTLHRLAWLRERTDRVYYFTGEGNAPSLDLHHALGFEIVARGVSIPLPPPFSNEERHVIAMKRLDDDR